MKQPLDFMELLDGKLCLPNTFELLGENKKNSSADVCVFSFVCWENVELRGKDKVLTQTVNFLNHKSMN